MLHYSCMLTAMLEAPGCRRMIVDNGYLESLSRPNVTPVFTGIGEITENGIIGEDGRLVRFVWVPHHNPRPLSVQESTALVTSSSWRQASRWCVSVTSLPLSGC